MKRILALIISLTAAAMLFAGCGDSDVYDRPGTGTTLSPDEDIATTMPEISDDNGSYSADPDGDVNQTTDGGILEDGEDMLESGAEDLGDGLEDLGGDIKDSMGEGENRTDEGDSHGATNGNSH